MKNNGKVIKNKNNNNNKECQCNKSNKKIQTKANLIYITTKTYLQTKSLCFYHSNWFCNLNVHYSKHRNKL